MKRLRPRRSEAAALRGKAGQVTLTVKPADGSQPSLGASLSQHAWDPRTQGWVQEEPQNPKAGSLGGHRTCSCTRLGGAVVHLQLQPAGWLCACPIDEGPPEPLLTVRGVARRSPVDEVPQVLQTEGLLREPPLGPPPPGPSEQPRWVPCLQCLHPHSGPALQGRLPTALLGFPWLPLPSESVHMPRVGSKATTIQPHQVPALPQPRLCLASHTPPLLTQPNCCSSSGATSLTRGSASLFPAQATRLVLLSPVLSLCPQCLGPGTKEQARGTKAPA